MGIIVSVKNEVSLDPNTDAGVVTCVEKNPTFLNKFGGRSLHVFRRVRGSTRGDGNPLIYAMKNRKGYIISEDERLKFYANAEIIIRNNAKFFAGFDMIFPIPSSSGFCCEFANIVSRETSLPLCRSVLLKKTTVREAVDSAVVDFGNMGGKSLSKSKQKRFSNITKELRKKSLDDEFEIKDITDKNYRKYFSPFLPVMNGSIVQGQKLVIVDDTVTSGRSLHTARLALEKHFGIVDARFVSFLGPLT